jgi:hypothetical protein
MDEDERSMTLGEFRVGISFNPSNNPKVDALKRMAADFIDLVETIIVSHDSIKSEVGRLKALAQTHIEDAAMWAVKATTKQP